MVSSVLSHALHGSDNASTLSLPLQTKNGQRVELMLTVRPRYGLPAADEGQLVEDRDSPSGG